MPTPAFKILGPCKAPHDCEFCERDGEPAAYRVRFTGLATYSFPGGQPPVSATARICAKCLGRHQRIADPAHYSVELLAETDMDLVGLEERKRGL